MNKQTSSNVLAATLFLRSSSSLIQQKEVDKFGRDIIMTIDKFGRSLDTVAASNTYLSSGINEKVTALARENVELKKQIVNNMKACEEVKKQIEIVVENMTDYVDVKKQIESVKESMKFAIAGVNEHIANVKGLHENVLGKIQAELKSNQSTALAHDVESKHLIHHLYRHLKIGKPRNPRSVSEDVVVDKA